MSILSYSTSVYRAFMAAILSLSTLVLVAAADPYMGDWPTQGGDMGRSGSVSGSIATRRLNVAWGVAIPTTVSSPAIVGGRLYYTEKSGGAVCLDARTGVQIWRRALLSIPTDSVTPPTVVGNRIFLTVFNNTSLGPPASAAMALVTAAVEPQVNFVAFAHEMKRIAISPRQRLDDVVNVVSNLSFGGTDCALPMIWAQKNGVKADAFIIYTDSETWANPKMHPVQALQEYRRRTGIPAKLIVVGMTSNGFSIADPNDAGMLDCAGFDISVPQLISDFVVNRI